MAEQSPYARLAADVERLVMTYPGTDPTVLAYMLARLSLLTVRALHGPERAAELAYKLGDEFAGEIGS